jgi:chromosome segregation ATPase
MIFTIAVIFSLLHPMYGFLLEPDKTTQHPGGHSTSTTMSQRLDALQRQMEQQNKTIEIQDQMIKELLNTLSGVNQSLSILSSLENHNKNQLSAFSSDLHTTKNRLNSLQGKASQNQHQVSSVSTQCSTVSSNISTLSRNLHSVQSSLTSVQTKINQNQHYSTTHISTLTKQFSTLSKSLQTTDTHISTLEHNLEETVIRSKYHQLTMTKTVIIELIPRRVLHVIKEAMCTDPRAC